MIAIFRITKPAMSQKFVAKSRIGTSTSQCFTLKFLICPSNPFKLRRLTAQCLGKLHLSQCDREFATFIFKILMHQT